MTNVSTAKEKEEILDRLLKVWLTAPNLKLGQLLSSQGGENFFYIEDYFLIENLEHAFNVKRPYKPEWWPLLEEEAKVLSEKVSKDGWDGWRSTPPANFQLIKDALNGLSGIIIPEMTKPTLGMALSWEAFLEWRTKDYTIIITVGQVESFEKNWCQIDATNNSLSIEGELKRVKPFINLLFKLDGGEVHELTSLFTTPLVE